VSANGGLTSADMRQTLEGAMNCKGVPCLSLPKRPNPGYSLIPLGEVQGGLTLEAGAEHRHHRAASGVPEGVAKGDSSDDITRGQLAAISSKDND